MAEQIDIDLHQKKEIELHKKLADGYYYRHSFEYSKVYQQYWHDEIIKMLPLDVNAKVLDLGCGTGLLLADLIDRFQFTIGLDISIDMLRALKANTDGINRLVNATGSRLPFLSNSFDVIVCKASLHHIRFLDRVLSEIRRVLKKKGLLVLSEPSNDCIFIRLVRSIMYKISKKFNEDDKAFITKELKSILMTNGFNVLAENRFGFFSYLFCGFPDHFVLMRYIPFNVKLSLLFKKIDTLLSKAPFIKNQSFHIIIKTQKTN